MTTIDPWKLHLPGYDDCLRDGFGTVDDYGTLVYVPQAVWWVFFAQSH